MFQIQNTLLLIIDVQGRLAQAMHDKDRLFSGLTRLIRMAGILDIPILLTEQAPEKLGPTIPEIRALLPHLQPVKKTTFSCCGQAELRDKIRATNRRQILLAGIETHVCVYQTAVDLLRSQWDVAVVVDAVSSRSPDDKAVALQHLKSLGAGWTTLEMISCELIGGADHPRFKEILNLIK